MKNTSFMNLNVKGKGKNTNPEGSDQPNKNTPKSQFNQILKFFTKERLDQSSRLSKQSLYPKIQNPNKQDKPIRKHTKDDIIFSSISPIRKLDKTPDVSFLYSKDYKAFVTPKKIIITDFDESIEENLNKIHKERCKSEAKHAKFLMNFNSNKHIEAISKWAKEKSHRQEELSRRFSVPKKIIQYSSRPYEDYDSDKEDVKYNYMDRVGKIRKLKHKLIEVSKHPDYEGKSGYISMQPQVKYVMKSRTPTISKKNIIIEAEKIKNSMVKKGVRCDLKTISCPLNESLSCKLPQGGEGLLKFEYIY
ncbi:hypothetical protein SteCoe_10440 [Stentor coeruleus]|uniref:Uncharacterized protein n=1 Tax=Stentor coeruleus TaxID=5963 RepID=A0A1R2CFJ1_9CILI|nr:hypothetical protein SteCoe_10440 [Stentor coeruleus]